MTDTHLTRNVAKTKRKQAALDQAAQARTGNVVALPARSQARPSDKVASFVKRHPVVTVAGALAAGAVVSAVLIPNKMTRRLGSKLLGRAVTMAETSGALAVLASRDGARKVLGAVKHADSEVEKTTSTAVLKMERYGLAALAIASTIGRVAAHGASVISDAAAHSAGRIGEAATERSHKIAEAAGDLKKRVAS